MEIDICFFSGPFNINIAINVNNEFNTLNNYLFNYGTRRARFSYPIIIIVRHNDKLKAINFETKKLSRLPFIQTHIIFINKLFYPKHFGNTP
jgi:hypothetical protein